MILLTILRKSIIWMLCSLKYSCPALNSVQAECIKIDSYYLIYNISGARFHNFRVPSSQIMLILGEIFLT